MNSIEWAPEMYLRLLKSAHVDRRAINGLLNSGVSYRRIAALYPFDARDFAEAFVMIARSSPAAMRSLLTVPPTSTLHYLETLVNGQRFPAVALTGMLESESIGKIFMDCELQAERSSLLVAGINVNLIPTVLYLLSEVSWDIFQIRSAAYRTVISNLPTLKLWLEEKIELLEAVERALPPERELITKAYSGKIGA